MKAALLPNPELRAAIERAGGEAFVLEPPASPGGGETALLGACLVEFERRLAAERADVAVVAATADPDLALALAATKLDIRVVIAHDAAAGDPDALGRALAVIADERVAQGTAPTMEPR
jgi:hypothetical protein